MAGEPVCTRPDAGLSLVDSVSRPTHGLRDWLLQRLTAVYLGCFLVYLLMHFLLQPQHVFQEWHDWITHPARIVATALFIMAVLIHGWVGMRDVVLDYVHTISLRLTILSLIGLALISCGLWTLRILLQVSA
jgi:succinate dehydrogenase / fumarate reductase membrane anchor subunit